MSKESENRNKQIASMREGGMTLQQIADSFGMSRQRVWQICEDEGVSRDIKQLRTQTLYEEAYAKAEEMEGLIMMRYIAGEPIDKIAHSLGIQVNATRELIDENTTLEVSSLRAKNIADRMYPEREIIQRKERFDRHWTEERVFNTLLDLAKKQNGLPSSIEYQKIAKGNKELPSFATVRSRFGRWSALRLKINSALVRG